MNDQLQQAIAALKSGDKATGQKLLIGVLKADPKNETAWLWLSTVVDDPQKRKDCLRTVLQINPHNEAARKTLASLTPTSSPQPKTEPEIPTSSPPLVPIADEQPSVPAEIPSPSTSEPIVSPTPARPVIKSALVKPISPVTPGSNESAAPKTSSLNPKSSLQNRTWLYVLVFAVGGSLIACIGCIALTLVVTSSPSFRATQTVRAVTAQARLNTPTPTSTPTATPTPTPSFVLLLPQELKNSQGWLFSINQVSLLDSIDTAEKRYVPERGVFLWLRGTVSNSSSESGCIHGDEFLLLDGNNKIEMSRDLAEAIHSAQGFDYPGFFLGQCLDQNEVVDTFVIFDVPKTATDLHLQLGESKVRLGEIAVLSQATPMPFIPPTPIPTDTPLPTDIPLPTYTPQPTSTLIPPDTPVELWPDEYKALVLETTLRSSGEVEVKRVSIDLVEGKRIFTVVIRTQGGTGSIDDETTLRESAICFIAGYQANQELKANVEGVRVRAQSFSELDRWYAAAYINSIGQLINEQITTEDFYLDHVAIQLP